MDETLLREILKVQTAILAELRLLRRDLSGEASVAAAPVQPAQPAQPDATPPATPAAPTPAHEAQPAQATAPVPPEPVAPPARPPQPVQSTGTMLTVDELTDLGGQFLEPGQMSRPKVTPVEASDLLRDIKAKNRAKRDAFAEFNKFGRDR